MVRILSLVILVLILGFEASPCIPTEEVKVKGSEIKSDILFFVTDENRVVQQHIAYIDNRAYFNFSECIKGDGVPGFTLRDADKFDLDKHCFFLGPWLPVFPSVGDDPVLHGLFRNTLSDRLAKVRDDMERVQFYAPIVDVFTKVLSDLPNAMLFATSTLALIQVYSIRPHAVTLNRLMGSGRGGKVAVGTGSFSAGIAWLGLFLSMFQISRDMSEATENSFEYRSELNEAVNLAHQMELSLYEGSKGHSPRHNHTSGIFISNIINAIEETMASISKHHSWICSDIVPQELQKQHRIEL